MLKKRFCNIQNETTCQNSFSRPSDMSILSKTEPKTSLFQQKLMESPNQLLRFTQNLTICSICSEGQKQTQKIIRKPCKCQLLVHKNCLQKSVQSSFKQSQKEQERLKCHKCKQFLAAQIKSQFCINRQKLCLFQGPVLYHYISCILIILGLIGLIIYYSNQCVKNQLQQKNYSNQTNEFSGNQNSLSQSGNQTTNNLKSNELISFQEIQTIIILMILFLSLVFIILMVNLFRKHLILVKKRIILIKQKQITKKSKFTTQDFQVKQKTVQVEKNHQ